MKPEITFLHWGKADEFGSVYYGFGLGFTVVEHTDPDYEDPNYTIAITLGPFYIVIDIPRRGR